MTNYGLKESAAADIATKSEKEDNPLIRKVGRLEISREFLTAANEKYLKELFSNFFPMAIENNHVFGLYSSLTFIGLSPHFRIVEEGSLIPQYRISINLKKDGNAELNKVEEINI